MDASPSPHGNGRLRQARIERNWRQQDLADQLGTTVLTIKRWERGSQQPGAYFRVKLCALFGKSAEELGLIPGSVTDVLSLEEENATSSLSEESRIWGVPFPRNPFFTGRDLLLECLHTLLAREPSIAALTQSYALSGLGGIGKTQVAIEYAYRYRAEYKAVLWVAAETQPSLTSSFTALAELLSLPEKAEKDQGKIMAVVLRWLNRHTGWLLIFDNVEDLSLIKSFLPASNQGALLFTTRLHTLGTLAQGVELSPMTMQEGYDFLLARTKRLHQEEEHFLSDPHEMAAARQIVDAMGGLPLALEQTGAYIQATQCRFSDYLRLFQSAQQRLLEEHDPSSDHPLSVSRTFTLAFECVEQRHPLAAAILTICAHLSPEPVPDMFFLEGASFLGPSFQVLAADQLAFPEAIKVLLSYSLLQRQPATRTIAMHRLVQAVLKAQLPEDSQRIWAYRIIKAMSRLFPSDEGMPENYWFTCDQLLPHAQVCLSLAAQWNKDELVRLPLMSHIATYLSRRLRYSEAEPLLEQAVQMGEHVLGPAHPFVAEALQGLADLCLDQSKYGRAELLYQRVLSIREQVLGPEHPSVGYPLNGLGNLSYMQGRYEQAEHFYQRARSIWEQALSLEHPQVTYPLANLGNLYLIQGHYERAEPLYQRALHIWEQAQGPEHPQVASSLTNLGFLYYEQSQYERAELLYQRALHIWEQAQGPEHPQVAFAFNNLGDLYYKQGYYERAEPLYQRALHIWEQAFGFHSPLVAYPLNGLANLSRDQSQYEQADALYERALTIRQEHLGPQHIEVAETLQDLAQLREKQQKFAEALSLYQQALTIREQVLGAHHPKTIDTRQRLSAVLQALGKTEDAAALEAHLDSVKREGKQVTH